MERCISKINKKDENKKIDRWQKISEVAAKQSGRDKIPKINNVINIDGICNIINKYNIIIVPYEKEEIITLKNIIDDIKNSENEIYNIGIVIGPEGGFEYSEIEKLKSMVLKLLH